MPMQRKCDAPAMQCWTKTFLTNEESMQTPTMQRQPACRNLPVSFRRTIAADFWGKATWRSSRSCPQPWGNAASAERKQVGAFRPSSSKSKAPGKF